jgi:hypothetical protein
MPYDSEDDTPAESLAVAYWDPYDNEWCFGGIKYPAFVGGFDTETHTVEFATECLHGLYAVVTERTLPQTPTVKIELLGDMYCGYFGPEPYFVLKVEDMSLMKEIDTGTWNIYVDDFPIVEYGDVSDYFDLDYDNVTNLLRIEPDYYYEDDYDNFLEHLACGDHVLRVGVKNIQGAYHEEAFDFTIDCAPPDVVFENSYVGKNPTIRFYVTDDLSGVDTSSIHVDVIAVGPNDTDPYTSCSCRLSSRNKSRSRRMVWSKYRRFTILNTNAPLSWFFMTAIEVVRVIRLVMNTTVNTAILSGPIITAIIMVSMIALVMSRLRLSSFSPSTTWLRRFGLSATTSRVTRSPRCLAAVCRFKFWTTARVFPIS